MTKRDRLQVEAADTYIKGTPRGILEIGTGIGKSVITTLVIKSLRPKSILILVNSTNLRDEEWPKTFKKFGISEDYWENTDVMCYQAAYNQSNLVYDLVIADEVDFSFTKEYHKVFVNPTNIFGRVLGLTAFVPLEKYTLMVKCFGINPIKVRYSTQQAQEDNILNKSNFVFVRYFLSKHPKSYEVKDRKGRTLFYTSENERYNYLQDKHDKAYEEIFMYNKPYSTLKWIVADRKSLLYNLKSSALVARNLVWKLLKEDEKNKVLVFSQYTAQADRICKYTYHSKNKGTKKNPSKVLDMFNEGDIRAFGVCGAINRGTNLIGLNNIIKESYDGSPVNFQQQHGRGVRLGPDEMMTFYILVPCYVDRKGIPRYTQAGTWVKEMIQWFNVKGKTKSIMVTYDDTKL